MMEHARHDVRFQEVQRFRQWWLLALVYGGSGAMIGLFLYGMFQQLVLGRTWGDKPMSDPALLIVGTGMVLFGALLIWLFARMRLTTQVRSDGLYIHFFPLHLRGPKKIPLEEAVKAAAVTYRPIRDYGGWGIRMARGSRAYNVSGDRGVRIDFADGRHLLIGSQRPEALAEAVRAII